MFMKSKRDWLEIVHICIADNMKRENDDNYEEPQQQGMETIAQDQGTDNDESQDAINGTNNFTNQNNEDNGVGPNPPKRQRHNEDEEIRLLIPSKVRLYNYIIFNLTQIFHLKMAGAVIGKGGQNIQKLRTEVCFYERSTHISYFRILLSFFMNKIPIPSPVSWETFPHSKQRNNEKIPKIMFVLIFWITKKI